MKLLNKLLISIAILTFANATVNAEKLVILHTNDTHSQIDPADDGLGGVLRRKALFDSIRNIEPNVLVFDAGDIVQGTLYFNLYKGEVEEKVMEALGYDVRILGNHEFDNGLEALRDNLRGDRRAQMLAANYQMKDTPLEGIFQPYTLFEYPNATIAVIPVNLNPDGMISKANYTGMGYVDAIEAANNLAWYLKNIIQTDYVIAMTHIGYESQRECDKLLAESSKDIDLIIGGHSHTLIDPSNPRAPYIFKNAEGKDIIIAQAGKAGKYIGEITIDLDSLQLLPKYQLIKVDSRLDDRIDPDMAAMLEPYRDAVDALNSRVIARSAKYLDKSRDALLNFAADFVMYRGKQLTDSIDFAIINKGGLRNSLPEGDITEGQIITMMPFFNKIEVIEVPGDSILETFHIMAKANGNGISKEAEAIYDPKTGKCTEIKINGKDVDPNRKYRVATIDYLATGGDYMHPLIDHNTVAISPTLLYEDMIEYLKNGPYKNKKIDAPDTPRMKPLE